MYIHNVPQLIAQAKYKLNEQKEIKKHIYAIKKIIKIK